METLRQGKRTKESSIERTEEIFRTVTDNYRLMWSAKPKGYKFELFGYLVKNEIIILQVFDDGGCQHYLGTQGIDWDSTKSQIIKRLIGE